MNENKRMNTLPDEQQIDEALEALAADEQPEEDELLLPEERKAEITINGRTYPLLFTTGAMIAVKKELGGLDAYLGRQQIAEASMSDIAEDVVKMVRILANQGAASQNFLHRSEADYEPIPMLSEEELILTTTPFELISMRAVIVTAINRGLAQSVHSTDPEKKHPAE